MNGEDKMKYSIIVAVDNSFALINNFIENLIKTTDIEIDGELIIVLDGCTDYTTIEYLKSLKLKNFHLLKNDVKLGYGVSNNKGAKISTGDYLVFINSDVFPTKNSISKLIEFIDVNQPSVGAVQGLLIYPQNNKVQSTGHLFVGLQNYHVYQGKSLNDPFVLKRGERQALTTAFCVVPRFIFFENGMFNEYYYNAYEGFEFTLKLTIAGLTCCYYPEAVAYHITGSTRTNMNIYDVPQGKYFIHNFGSKIIPDVEDYIAPQLTPIMKNRIYTIINLSIHPEWNDIIEHQNIKTNGNIGIHCNDLTEANLYHLLPYSSLDFQGDYLFLVNSLKQISMNFNWIANRASEFDMIMDSHGNVERLKAFIK